MSPALEGGFLSTVPSGKSHVGYFCLFEGIAPDGYLVHSSHYSGLPWWLRQQRIHQQCGRPGFNPWLGKIPWRRECLPTPVFLLAESHGQRNLAGCSPWGRKELDTTEWLSTAQHVAQPLFITMPHSNCPLVCWRWRTQMTRSSSCFRRRCARLCSHHTLPTLFPKDGLYPCLFSVAWIPNWVSPIQEQTA